MPVPDSVKYLEKVEVVRPNIMLSGPLKFAQVKICGPTNPNAKITTSLNTIAPKSTSDIQFDAPVDMDKVDWKSSERTKLRVEVTFNYRLPIPFANMLIYYITRGQENADLLLVTRLGTEQTQLKDNLISERAEYDMMARAGQGYVLPIRATYTMRMMSDLYPDKSGFELPQQNTCTIPFPRSGGE